ncbi:MAG: dihydroorotase [Alphaproteobacteria bacterium]|nr:dihydroorotase [Pseudomonadota bacterium]TDI68225.1 MAG: dihydroorotase [Alphaproteobacteria bacterium]
MNGAERVAFVNARLVDLASGVDGPGALLVEGRHIADLGPRLFADGVPEGVKTVDCRGDVLAPGLVDMRVTVHETSETHKENLVSAAQAAVAGGVTAMAIIPGPNQVIDSPAQVEFLITRGLKTALTDVYPYGAVTRGTEGQALTEMGLLAEAGVVGFTDGPRALADADTMRRALSYGTLFGLPIIQHPEEPSLAAGGQMNEGEISTRLGLQGIPAAAEVMMIERDLRLLELTNGLYHVAHVTTAAAIEVIGAAKARGLAVTCDTAPPYFGLNETAVGEYRTFAKLSPPLRAESDREAVVEGLRDGTIDVIASDHLPQDPDSKRLPFAQAEPGGIGLETLLPLVLELYHGGALGLGEALAKVTSAPARLLGLDAGRLVKGAPANLALIEVEAPWKIKEDDLVSKSKNTPFDGRPVQGRCRATVFAGRMVFEAVH